MSDAPLPAGSSEPAEDEAPLPGEGGDQGDGLSARFSSPPDDED